jgi:hypothetical protein
MSITEVCSFSHGCVKLKLCCPLMEQVAFARLVIQHRSHFQLTLCLTLFEKIFIKIEKSEGRVAGRGLQLRWSVGGLLQ